MESNEEKMKLEKIPYLRAWVNIFNYRAYESKKDFLIDFIFLIIIKVIISIVSFIVIKQLDIDYLLFFLLPLLAYGILSIFQLIGLFARRLTDIGMQYGFAFFTFCFISIPFLFGICLGKSKDELDDEKYKQKHKKRKIILFIPIFIAAFAIPMIIIVPIIYDIIVPETIMEECTDFEKYDEYVEKTKYASNYMPKLNELDNYEDVKFGYRLVCDSKFMGFYSDGISLFVTYDDNYYDEKDKILNNYDYLKEEEIIDVRNESQFPLTIFNYKGYTIQIVPNRNYWSDGKLTCQSFMMVGYNDSKKTIVYMYYYDFDIDYLYDKSDKETREEIMHRFIDVAFIWYEI